MHVRLKKKLANVMDGVDVSHVRPGDVLRLTDTEGEIFIREGWAERVPETSSTSVTAHRHHHQARMCIRKVNCETCGHDYADVLRFELRTSGRVAHLVCRECFSQWMEPEPLAPSIGFHHVALLTVSRQD